MKTRLFAIVVLACSFATVAAGQNITAVIEVNGAGGMTIKSEFDQTGGFKIPDTTINAPSIGIRLSGQITDRIGVIFAKNLRSSVEAYTKTDVQTGKTTNFADDIPGSTWDGGEQKGFAIDATYKLGGHLLASVGYQQWELEYGFTNATRKKISFDRVYKGPRFGVGTAWKKTLKDDQDLEVTIWGFYSPRMLTKRIDTNNGSEFPSVDAQAFSARGDIALGMFKHLVLIGGYKFSLYETDKGNHAISGAPGDVREFLYSQGVTFGVGVRF